MCWHNLRKLPVSVPGLQRIVKCPFRSIPSLKSLDFLQTILSLYANREVMFAIDKVQQDSEILVIDATCRICFVRVRR